MTARTTTRRPANRDRCAACGSTASITRTSRARTLALCYGHEAVCSAHLLDPCPECDAA